MIIQIITGNPKAAQKPFWLVTPDFLVFIRAKSPFD
jgi:hypothetical protein